MTSEAGNIELAAEVQVISCGASRCITASPAGAVPQPCGNAGAGRSRWDPSAGIYRITRPDNVVQERSPHRRPFHGDSHRIRLF